MVLSFYVELIHELFLLQLLIVLVRVVGDDGFQQMMTRMQLQVGGVGVRLFREGLLLVEEDLGEVACERMGLRSVRAAAFMFKSPLALREGS